MTHLRTPDPLLLKQEIQRLRAENAALREQLRIAQAHRLVVMRKAGDAHEDKPVSEWTAVDFVGYFRDKYYEYTAKEKGQGRAYRFRRRERAVVLGMISELIMRERMTNEQFKEVIDFHFHYTFVRRKDPSILFICSERGMDWYNLMKRELQRQSGGQNVGNQYAQPSRLAVPQQQFPTARQWREEDDVQ